MPKSINFGRDQNANRPIMFFVDSLSQHNNSIPDQVYIRLARFLKLSSVFSGLITITLLAIHAGISPAGSA